MQILSINERRNTITVQNSCPLCGKIQIKRFELAGFNKWRFGRAYIQDALSSSSADDREFLMTGICNDCFPKEI